jgi:predicted amidophosphoribosyltransferase
METVNMFLGLLTGGAFLAGCIAVVKWALDSIIECCPSCGDPFDDRASQCRPIWSDNHDNIVCVTCKENY